jgi:hypothetical protein
VAGELCRSLVGGVVRGDTESLPDDLGQAQNDTPSPVGQASAAMAQRVRRQCLAYLSNSWPSRDFADSSDAGHREKTCSPAFPRKHGTDP